ncbi:MAG: hypothetical protein Q4C89_11770 [Deinococcus sp.]|uniref:hypothetical protein n=1 Tax=Deinococcus sp. TaxID=47478 RepID=UPI0026DBCBFA|nr:hypothetical protein [Deinococcus sp.]MDO4246691.1 hypothetical protein [Deinococcus sp.]
MNRLLGAGLLLATLSACAPQVTQNPVQVWEGEGRVLLQQQKYRLTFSVEPKSHQLSGTLENQKTGDRFLATGSLLPTSGGAELTAYLSAGGGAKLGASAFGVGVSGVALKADALLSGRVVGETFSGALRVNGVAYPLELRRLR